MCLKPTIILKTTQTQRNIESYTVVPKTVLCLVVTTIIFWTEPSPPNKIDKIKLYWFTFKFIGFNFILFFIYLLSIAIIPSQLEKFGHSPNVRHEPVAKTQKDVGLLLKAIDLVTIRIKLTNQKNRSYTIGLILITLELTC